MELGREREGASWLSAWFPSRQALGRLRRGRVGVRVHYLRGLGVQGWFASLQGVASLPASPSASLYFPCLEFSATPLVTLEGGGWEEVPPPQRLAHSTRQRLPWADVLPFPSRGEPVAGCLGTLEEGQGDLSHGALSSHALMDSGVRKPGHRLGAGGWSSGHVQASAYYPGEGFLPAHHSWNCNIAPT